LAELRNSLQGKAQAPKLSQESKLIPIKSPSKKNPDDWKLVRVNEITIEPPKILQA
jgi:hypothetical protein